MEGATYKIEKQDNLVIMLLTLDSVLWDDNKLLTEAFTKLLDEGNKNIILDLANTTYISSVVLASFVYMLKRAKESGGNMVFCNVNKKVKEILTMTNLDKVFDIAENRQEAIKQLPKK